MKLVRTGVLKIQSQPVFSEINAASASVWNECLQLMEWYQWQRGYPHAHDAFWIGPDCEGWMDKNGCNPNHYIHKASKPSAKVAVIGCGRIANDGHLPAYRTAAEAGLCTLVGVCDVVPERAQQTARRYGTVAFETAEDMIAETQPEAVSITTHAVESSSPDAARPQRRVPCVV